MKQYLTCFRGYTFGNNKGSTEKHKGVDRLRTLEEIQSSGRGGQSDPTNHRVPEGW